MLITIAHYTIAAGCEEKVLALVAELEIASREEAGCLAFDGYLKIGNASALVLLERYESVEAFEAHRATPHFERLVLGQIVPLLSERTVDSFTVSES